MRHSAVICYDLTMNFCHLYSVSVLSPHPDSAGDLPDGDADRVSEEGPQRQGVPTESGPNQAGGEDSQAQRRALQGQPTPQVP